MTDDLVKDLRTGIYTCEGVRALRNRAADHIETLEALTMYLLRSNWDASWPTMRKYDTFEEYARKALEGKTHLEWTEYYGQGSEPWLNKE